MNIEFERHGPDQVVVAIGPDGESIVVRKIAVEALAGSGVLAQWLDMVWPESAGPDEDAALDSAFRLLEAAVTRRIEDRRRDAWMQRYRVGFGTQLGVHCRCGAEITSEQGLGLDIPYSLDGLVDAARNHSCRPEYGR